MTAIDIDGERRGRPSSASFPVRKLGADYTDIDRYFYAGQPIATWFAITGSLLFPDGEMFFVRSVKAVADRIDDPQLLADIQAFAGQEGSHAGEHRRVNKVIERRFGLDAQASADLMNRVLGLLHKEGSRELDLAATAALEHFTGIIGAALLRDEHFADNVTSPAIRNLLLWHALEECEHRAVTYDAYRAAGGTYALRASMMAATTALALAVYGHTFLGAVARDGQLTNVRSWAHFVHGSLRKQGLLRPVLRRYLAYYRPGFHPLDDDTTAVEQHWRERLSLKGRAVAAG